MTSTTSTTASTLNWHTKRDGNGYWATSPAGDELVIWGRSRPRSRKDGEGFTLNVNGEVPAHGVKLAEAKAAAEAWVEDHLPKAAPVTAGSWSIDDAGNLWKDGEYIGRIAENQRSTNGRTFHAQGVDVTDPAADEPFGYGSRRYISIGSSTARTISAEEHAALNNKVAR